MELEITLPGRRAVSLWRDTVAPKEHGSWSLAFEPLVLALLVAPSVPGALLALALAAAFFARRPLRIVRVEQKPGRSAAAWQALAGCVGIALSAFAGAVMMGGLGWLGWLLPLVIASGVFAWFDLRGAGREEAAEIAGAAAFALAPAAIAALAGWTRLECMAIAMVVLGRSVPSVLCVRAFLRAAKTGVRHDAPALIAACLAAAASLVLVHVNAVPFVALVAMAGFAARAFALLVIVRPTWRARTVGMSEAILGVAFVIGLAIAWR